MAAVFFPDGSKRKLSLPLDLDSLQGLVGGNIEPIYFTVNMMNAATEEIAPVEWLAWVNEDFLFNGSEYNFLGSILVGQPVNGPVVAMTAAEGRKN